ncbi:MAG: hypothetical protein EOO17_04780 [Chloroflexi bacterium]|nr:MAG: hypothetical protein EOO17_04780 [Chloroflexota bacterium]
MKDSARPFLRPIHAAVSCSLIFVFAFMAVIAPVVSAQDAQPIFTPSTTSGELRNTQRISLQVNDANYTQPTIQVLNKDDAKPLPDDRVIKAVADKDATTVVLTWDTQTMLACMDGRLPFRIRSKMVSEKSVFK